MPQGTDLLRMISGTILPLALCFVGLLLAGRKLPAHPKARSYLRIGLVLLILHEVCITGSRVFVTNTPTGLTGPALIAFAQKLAVFSLVSSVTWLGGMVLLIMAAFADRKPQQEAE